jgi:hypothetical protein
LLDTSASTSRAISDWSRKKKSPRVLLRDSRSNADFAQNRCIHGGG